VLLPKRTVTTDEAIKRLPDLLREIKSRAVVIQDGVQAVGAPGRIDVYQVVRKPQVEQALKAMNDFGNAGRASELSNSCAMRLLRNGPPKNCGTVRIDLLSG